MVDGYGLMKMWEMEIGIAAQGLLRPAVMIMKPINWNKIMIYFWQFLVITIQYSLSPHIISKKTWNKYDNFVILNCGKVQVLNLDLSCNQKEFVLKGL